MRSSEGSNCLLLATLTLVSTLRLALSGNYSKSLYDHLLEIKKYEKLIRPVGNSSDRLTVKLSLRLIKIIDVDEKNQIMTTSVWLEQQWYDYKLQWDPKNYGGIKRIYIPAKDIWLPDIVLYNSADGSFTVDAITKATVYNNGLVVWKPPAIYKSLCQINVEYFPFDEQMCTLKIGSWTYDGYSVDIRHKDLPDGANDQVEIEKGIDLGDYDQSTEWDLMSVKAQKFEMYYPCCPEPYPDIKFNIVLRRRILFYTVNLILPCVVICSVTLLLFYMPAHTGEKITMGITILNSLNIFLLLIAEINPPTSLSTPLIGRYLLFTMMLVTCSIIVTVFVLNIHFRSPSTHVMSPWIRTLFLHSLPRLLLMQRPRRKFDRVPQVAARLPEGIEIRSSYRDYPGGVQLHTMTTNADGYAGENHYTTTRRQSILPQTVMHAVIGVNFIVEHIKHKEDLQRIKQDWQFVAMVVDRLFLWIFSIVCLIGTFCIIVQAPTLYDTRLPLG